MLLNRRLVKTIVERALEEDLGHGDLTSCALFSEEARAEAVITAKEEGVLAGLPVAGMVFQTLDSDLEWVGRKKDGGRLAPGDVVAELRGSLRSILAGERVALNFLQRLSGIATLTARFRQAVNGFRARILDTRKTSPGLRVLEKYAVRVGGGLNHRFGLYDGILLKDNHIRAAGSIQSAVSVARKNAPPGMKIEVETTKLREVEAALQAGAEIIMLDNMPPGEMAEAVRLSGGRALVEASGGISLEDVREVAQTGVDFISVGALTHSAKALDFSLEITECLASPAQPRVGRARAATALSERES